MWLYKLGVFSAFPLFVLNLREGKVWPVNTQQGEGGYNNVVDDNIIFIYLFSLCEAVAMRSRPWPHAGS